jgi:hypothetical protein
MTIIQNINNKVPPKISIAVVNFNCGALLADAVAAVLASTACVEVFLVDNGSVDGSVARVLQRSGHDTRLSVIENGRNLGFTAASNIALKQATGEFVLLLNPDCIVPPDSLAQMVDLLEQQPEVGMAGCLLRNRDGSEQAGCRRAVPTPWRSLVRVLHLNKLFPEHPRFRNFLLNQEPLPQEPVLVEAISGAFMLVRRTAMEQVGLLDEGYFLHCDDLDWCMRFRQLGWKILFVPHVEALHHKGVCSCGHPMFVLWHKHKGMVRFYRKFFRHQYPLPLMGLVIATVWLRFAVLAVLSERRSYWRLAKSALLRATPPRHLSVVESSVEHAIEATPQAPLELGSESIAPVAADLEKPERIAPKQRQRRRFAS